MIKNFKAAYVGLFLVLSGAVYCPSFAKTSQVPAESESTVAWFRAIEGGDVKTVASMVKSGFDIETEDSNGATGLIRAVGRGNHDIAMFLVESGANVNARVRRSGWYAINEAAYNGDERMVIFLLDSGANVNARTKWGQTPLFLAMRHGRADVAELLINRGAKVNERDSSGWGPAAVVTVRGNIEGLKLLLKRGVDLKVKTHAKETLLFLALLKGNLTTADFLISNGVNVNERTKDGKTALEYFVRKGDMKNVEFLVKNGAALNKSILVHAAGNKEMEEYLNKVMAQKSVNAK